jgi:hypothetical protein
METENDNDVLINTLLSFKHVLASYHDTIENYILALEEIEDIHKHYAKECKCQSKERVDTNLPDPKSFKKLSEVYPDLAKKYNSL